jgi:hypothetical protein
MAVLIAGSVVLLELGPIGSGGLAELASLQARAVLATARIASV